MNYETTNTQLETVTFGKLLVHNVDASQTVDLIVKRAQSGVGGMVVTPNVDHICTAEVHEEFENALSRAFLSVPDGQPLVWMAKGMGRELKAKVSGSDLVEPLINALAEAELSVYFLGATAQVCELASEKLIEANPKVKIVGYSSPFYNHNGGDASEIIEAFSDAKAKGAAVILVALGSPKQEIAMARYLHVYDPAIAIGIGASLDFIAGKVKRAPSWASDHGLEWLYRLVKEPKRLWRRYLVNDRAIVGIFLRTRKSGVNS